eukprot:5394322-Prorocentrum_lima.AAC.1
MATTQVLALSTLMCRARSWSPAHGGLTTQWFPWWTPSGNKPKDLYVCKSLPAILFASKMSVPAM